FCCFVREYLKFVWKLFPPFGQTFQDIKADCRDPLPGGAPTDFLGTAAKGLAVTVRQGALQQTIRLCSTGRLTIRRCEPPLSTSHETKNYRKGARQSASGK
ncbi:MAG: hypothetical protein ABFD21_07220, partial [Anaerolineaceae bacterium]